MGGAAQNSSRRAMMDFSLFCRLGLGVDLGVGVGVRVGVRVRVRVRVGVGVRVRCDDGLLALLQVRLR